MYTCIESVERDLLCHKRLRERYKKELYRLKEYEGYALTLETRRNRKEYYICNYGNPDFKPKYCNRNLAKQREKIQEKRFLKESIQIIEENIYIIENFLKEYRPIEPEIIEEKLPKAYRGVHDYAPKLFTGADRGQWRNRHLKIKEQRGPHMPQKLIHTTLDGTKCRSRAEVDIYNYMLQRGMVFVYEPYLQLEDAWVIPDFMFIARDGNEVIIEYFGRTSDDMYMGRQYQKIEAYIRNGWVPNENLILAFESAEQEFNSQAIARVIDLYI